MQADSMDYNLLWLSGGIGAGGSGPAISLDIRISPVDRSKYYGLHFLTSQGFKVVDEVHTVALVRGKCLNQKYGFSGATAGIGPVWGKMSDFYSRNGLQVQQNEAINFFTVGINLMAEVRFDPTKYTGAGFFVVANINTTYPYMGLMMHFSIGDLKP